MADNIYGALLSMYIVEDHGIVGIPPWAVELCTKIMVVHALGIWSLSSHIY